MIELNITLFVQMIHFLFIWWFLDTFLCRYLVQVVQQEQQEQDVLVEQVDAEKVKLEELQLDQAARWAQWCSRFRSSVPALDTQIKESEFLVKKEPVQEPSKKDAQEAVATVAQRIVQKVLHE